MSSFIRCDEMRRHAEDAQLVLAPMPGQMGNCPAGWAGFDERGMKGAEILFREEIPQRVNGDAAVRDERHALAWIVPGQFLQ